MAFSFVLSALCLYKAHKLNNSLIDVILEDGGVNVHEWEARRRIRYVYFPLFISRHFVGIIIDRFAVEGHLPQEPTENEKKVLKLSLLNNFYLCGSVSLACWGLTGSMW
jgi:hypothetical protein